METIKENAARLRALNNNTRYWKEEYYQTRIEARKILRHKERQHLAEKIKIIESKKITNNPRKFYREIKNNRCIIHSANL